MKRYILIIGLLLSGIWTTSMASEDTVDISYILPNGGYFSSETAKWALMFDTTYSLVYFCTTCSEPYVGFRCLTTSSNVRPQMGIISKSYSSSSTATLDISSVKRQEILFTIVARGSPDTTYGCGTIFGYIQPEFNSAYWGNFTSYRVPGFSPGYLYSSGLKAESVDTTIPIAPVWSYATFLISTSWNTYNCRVTPIHQNFYKFGYIGVNYKANNSKAVNPIPSTPFATELQIKQIVLKVIRFY